MKFRLGLTGSIGMGKSTTAQMFADEGCAVWDADAAVHRLYAEGGEAVAGISEVFPQAIEGGTVSRAKLRQIIAADPEALARIERIVHPLVARDRARFIDEADADIVVLDIPLLFETGAEAGMDAVVCVTAPADVQRQRVLARGSMTPAQFEVIRAKQMPDAEKRARADHVVFADTLEHARAQVQDIVRQTRDQLAHA